jgi:hypothetical protein
MRKNIPNAKLPETCHDMVCKDIITGFNQLHGNLFIFTGNLHDLMRSSVPQNSEKNP